MSITPGRTVIFTERAAPRVAARVPVVWVPAVRVPAPRVRAPSPVVAWCVERVPGIVGRFGLALVPFSLLAWMFSV